MDTPWNLGRCNAILKSDVGVSVSRMPRLFLNGHTICRSDSLARQSLVSNLALVTRLNPKSLQKRQVIERTAVSVLTALVHPQVPLLL